MKWVGSNFCSNRKVAVYLLPIPVNWVPETISFSCIFFLLPLLFCPSLPNFFSHFFSICNRLEKGCFIYLLTTLGFFIFYFPLVKKSKTKSRGWVEETHTLSSLSNISSVFCKKSAVNSLYKSFSPDAASLLVPCSQFSISTNFHLLREICGIYYLISCNIKSSKLEEWNSFRTKIY